MATLIKNMTGSYTHEDGNSAYKVALEDEYGGIKTVTVCPTCDLPYPDSRCQYCNVQHCASCLTMQDPGPDDKGNARDKVALCSDCSTDQSTDGIGADSD